ncbi:MAG: adenosylmethionine--8-amino-7-oxononanoate transaminase [Kiritimatiellae bacterium]|nr:adenosylmethionine--8-amino-7-oxononanoate transaminase [Kiritimatiellia bacterium]
MPIDADACRALDRRHLWHPFTRRSAVDGEPFPVITRGEGCYLYDTDGTRYLDAIASWWCCNLGHGHPRLMEAIRRQTRELDHSILGNLSHPRAVELATELAGLLPGERHILFAGDGASAVEAALKIALQYWHNVGQPQRCRFASLAGAYHGDTLGALSVGYVEQFHAPFAPLVQPVFRADSPCCERCAWNRQPPDCGLPCFESMQRIVDEHGPELAAVIVEPLCQGAAGMRIYPHAWLRRLADLCAARDVLLIADEIAVGFGRTGTLFAFEQAAVAPDIVCLGKGLSAGCLPISAAAVADRLYATFSDKPADRTFYHGHTFAGNPLACAAALEMLRVYREDGIVQEAARKGRLLAERMAPLRELPGVAAVRWLGLIGAVELDGAVPGRAQQVQARLRRQGILLRPLGEVVYLMPPLVIPDDVLGKTVACLYDSLRHG